MNFIYQHLPQRFYIHLPGVYEFYLRALVQRFYIHLNTLALWILFPRNLFISLGAKAMKSTNMKNRVCAGRIFSWPCARKIIPLGHLFSPNFGIFKVQWVCPMEKYLATLGLQPKKSVEFLGAEFVGDCKRINRALATWTLSRYVLCQNHCQWVTNVPRHTTKPQTPRFSSHTSLFWTLPEQLSIVYPTRVPTLNQCPKTHHKTSDPKIFILHIPVLNFAGADLHIIPHMCANPSWTNVPRHTTKPQTPRFSSHRSLFWTLPEQISNLHIIPHMCANPSWTNVPRHTTKPQTPRCSSHTSLFWTLPEQISILYPTCVPTHLEPMSQDRPQNLRPQDFHLTHPCFELCRSRSPYYTPHVCQPWTNVPRQTTKPQTPRFSSHTSLFWTLPEQISILYPTCVPTLAEPMSQDTPQNLRPQDSHLTDPCFELCRSRSPYYTPHVWQPILNQCPKTHHKTSDPKIFISHIPVLNFAGTDLHIIPHMCANLEPMSQDTPQNLRPQDFHLTHPCFELCRSRSPYYTPHVCQPILNQCPKTHHKTSDPKIFISHIPVLNFAGADLEFPYYSPHVCQPWTNVPRHTTKPQTPRFSSHTSLFWTLPEQISNLHIIPHMCANPCLNQCPKTHHKTSDPKIFISHIPFLNFAGADLHIIPHMCANPSWTNVPRQTTKPQTPRFSSHTSLFWTLPEQISILYPTCVATHPDPMSQDTPQNLRPQDVHLTHPCFELCRSRSPYYTPHVCQPILNQCPKTDHKTSDPKIFISHIPVLNFAGADLHIIPHTCANLEPMSQDRPQNLRPQDFHLTHPCFELCRSRSPYYPPHVCQPILNQCPKTHQKTSDPKIFISHIPVLNLARTDVGFELRGTPKNSRDSSWTWSLGWKMWKGNKGHAYLNASNLTQGFLLFSYVWLEQPQCLDVSTGSA